MPTKRDVTKALELVRDLRTSMRVDDISARKVDELEAVLRDIDARTGTRDPSTHDRK